MKILIVGGGIGGLTLGGFLEHSNIEYDFVDRSTNWARQGFLIGLWDNGRDILKKLGLSDAFDKEGTRMHVYEVRDGKGRMLRRYNLREFYANFGSALTCIDRCRLHELLLSTVDQRKIKMSTSVKSLSEDADGVNVIFSDDTRATYDVVVGADGVRSIVRQLLFKDAVETYENWRVWYTWLDDKFNVPGSMTEYVEPAEFALVFKAGGKTHASLIAPADHAVWDNAEGRVERVKQLLKDETVLIPSALQHMTDNDLQPSDLMEIHLKEWARGRVALLGDAAHGFGPHAALGSSMAMEDAYVLAGELMKVSRSFPVENALLSYVRKREKRVRIARSLSMRVRLYTLVKSPLLRHLMNLFARLVPQHFVLGGFSRLLKQEV